jgi:hypothetical protein
MGQSRYDALRDLEYIREAKERAMMAYMEGTGVTGLTVLERSFYKAYASRVMPMTLNQIRPMTSSNHVQRVQGDR